MRRLVVALIVLPTPLAASQPARTAITVAVATYSSDTTTSGPTDTSRIRIDSIWVSMRDLRLRPAVGCKPADAVSLIAGPATAELARRRATAIGEPAKLAVARYCMLELTLHRAKTRPAGAPDVLRGASIVIQGRRADGVRVVVRSRLQTSLQLAARDLEGLATAEQPARWILAVDSARWMTGVDVSLAEVDRDGRGRELRVDEQKNSEVLARFEANVLSGMGLYVDANDNRELDPDELAHPIAAGY